MSRCEFAVWGMSLIADTDSSASKQSEHQRFLALARELEAAGHSIDEVLGALRTAGAYAIPSIKVLRDLYGFSLSEAKERLHGSPVWVDEVPRWERLHEELERAFLELDAQSTRSDPALTGEPDPEGDGRVDHESQDG
jgi:hypothetical protein